MLQDINGWETLKEKPTWETIYSWEAQYGIGPYRNWLLECKVHSTGLGEGPMINFCDYSDELQASWQLS